MYPLICYALFLFSLQTFVICSVVSIKQSRYPIEYPTLLILNPSFLVSMIRNNLYIRLYNMTYVYIYIYIDITVYTSCILVWSSPHINIYIFIHIIDISLYMSHKFIIHISLYIHTSSSTYIIIIIHHHHHVYNVRPISHQLVHQPISHHKSSVIGVIIINHIYMICYTMWAPPVYTVGLSSTQYTSI